ncbi:MAG: phosphoglycerate dehydrogenase [Chloroflexi bacterium]|nr:phosphoglycerate dehydrogenase [Chloroflexota bacterium]
MAQETSLEKTKIKVLLLEAIHRSAVDAFIADGYTNLGQHDRSLSEADLIERIGGVHILGIRSRTEVTERVLARADKLIAIGCFGIGTDQVDLAAAEICGIPVFNAPFSNTRSVAELVLAEVIALSRGIPERNAAAHRGQWMKAVSGATEVRGKRLGIVGYGHIGTQVGLLAEGLGMRVIYYDIEAKLALGNASPVGSLDDLLERSDVVTLHVPETPRTFHLIGEAQLARMRKGAKLINASRGSVVDIEALAHALEAGRLSGAAIDVFPEEPGSNEQEFISPLRRFDNVILTPHIGGSTLEAQENIGVEVAAKLVKYSDNGSTVTSVNFPEVALPEHAGKHRILHIHRNQPGMLAQVNAVFSQAKINIASQYLETNPRIGYAVIDIDAERPVSIAIRKELDAIDGTIRTRLLY